MATQNYSDLEPVTDNEIVRQLIGQMESGVAPWRKPWADSAAGVIIGSSVHDGAMWPSNLRAPKVPFGVFNGTMLLARASSKRYRTNLWVPLEVVAELGVRVVDDDDRPTAIQRFHQYEAYSGSQSGIRLVYNIDQIDDCEKSLGLAFFEKRHADSVRMQFKRSKKLLERLKVNHSLQIVRDNRAAYTPSWDVVMMPDIEQFAAAAETAEPQEREAEANYWATMWHEVVHWTGHPNRLDRDHHVRWGDKIYAFEELIAELGAAFLCASLGINGELQHESYLDSWCRALKQDSVRSLWEASAYAAAAKDFILEKGEPRQDSPLFGV